MSNDVKREVMKYDVVIVGAGPAGLATALKLKQLNKALSICILEKGAEVGAHILSGNVFETRALDELIVYPNDLYILQQKQLLWSVIQFQVQNYLFD